MAVIKKLYICTKFNTKLNTNLKKKKMKKCEFTYPELRYLLTSVENQKIKMIDEVNDNERLKERYKETIKKLSELETKLSALYVADLGKIIEKIK